ncbi:MAG TPA: hypothetical protein VEQ40_04970, partial [Pyrinomonadaceae bacterium]|nr:hypothetical protein [Pyrinomonadaceae bacterium]
MGAAEIKDQLAAHHHEIDGIAFRLYGIGDRDRRDIEASFTVAASPIADDEQAETEDEAEDEPAPADAHQLTSGLLSYAVGCAFGRWDVRFATSECPAPILPDPFAPLPVCAPGALTGDDELPTDTPPHDYPLNIARDAILLDDSGHSGDFDGSVRAVFETIWPTRADEIYREAARLLDSRDDNLRAWLAKNFFADHLKRYSKSRRKAPIYWQLATPSASFSVWLYYHRFTTDTFYKVVNDYVKPKIDHEELRLARLRQEAGSEPTRSQRRDIEAQEAFVAELKTFREEAERVAPLWRPNLNDGVIINFAPLWRLVPQHKGWQKECKAVWDNLVGGYYDWSNLAMRLWPERVVPKCQKDLSLAIAHNLTEAFWQQDDDGKWQPKEVAPGAVERLVVERAS